MSTVKAAVARVAETRPRVATGLKDLHINDMILSKALSQA